MVTAIVTAHNHGEAKEEFCRKYTPGYMAEFVHIRARVWNPRMMREILNSIPGSILAFEVSAKIRYILEV